MKYLRTTLLVVISTSFLSTSLARKASGSYLVLYLKNSDSTYYGYALNNADVLFEDTMPDPVDTFYLDLKEPTLFVFIVSNDTSKRFSGYLDIGKNEIILDLQYPRHPLFINSPINDELIYWRKKMDSVQAITYTQEALAMMKAHGKGTRVYDSIYNLLRQRWRDLDRLSYKEWFDRTHSFLTLNSIYFQLSRMLLEKEQAVFTKEELWALFRKLDRKMKKYPTYKECLRLFDLPVGKTPDIAPPLYTPQ